MCLSRVGQVREVAGDDTALCEVDGDVTPVSLTVLTLEDIPVAVGDWLLIHTGMAVEILEPGPARELDALHREIRAALPAAHEQEA